MSDVKVRRGDTLNKIARQHHVSLGALERANKQIRDPNEISVGQVVHVPDHFQAPTDGAKKKAAPKAQAAKSSASANHLKAPYKRWFGYVRDAAKKFHVRMATLFGIMSRETNGRNVIGDGGHGRGLMQIDDRTWGSWLRTHKRGLDPRSNIMKGASILRQNLDFFKGKVAASKVRRAAIAAYNAGPGNVLNALRRGRSADSVTTGGNYSRDVIARADKFAKQLKG